MMDESWIDQDKTKSYAVVLGKYTIYTVFGFDNIYC